MADIINVIILIDPEHLAVAAPIAHQVDQPIVHPIRKRNDDTTNHGVHTSKHLSITEGNITKENIRPNINIMDFHHDVDAMVKQNTKPTDHAHAQDHAQTHIRVTNQANPKQTQSVTVAANVAIGQSIVKPKTPKHKNGDPIPNVL